MAACQVTPGSEWILAKVLNHDTNTGMYKLADEDIESNKSEFNLMYILALGTFSFVVSFVLTPLCINFVLL